MTELNVEQFFQFIPTAFQPEKSEGIDALVQFDLKDKEVRSWTVEIKDKQCKVREGAQPNPTVTLTANTQDCIRIFTGKLDPATAFMQGRIKVGGNMPFAMKLLNLFKLG
ncbi:MAG: SCP2 sterol-binding domain-containing protein [Anaerolineaceae bacterium]